MTSPISLLVPATGAEPASQPAAAEGPALFAAALVAALQSAMAAMPMPAPVAIAPAAPQGEAGDPATGEQKAASPEGDPAQAATPTAAGIATPATTLDPVTAGTPVGALAPASPAAAATATDAHGKSVASTVVAAANASQSVVDGGGKGPAAPTGEGVRLAVEGATDARGRSGAPRSPRPQPQGVGAGRMVRAWAPEAGRPTTLGELRDGARSPASGNAPDQRVRDGARVVAAPATEEETIIATAAAAMRESRSVMRPAGTPAPRAEAPAFTTGRPVVPAPHVAPPVPGEVAIPVAVTAEAPQATPAPVVAAPTVVAISVDRPDPPTIAQVQARTVATPVLAQVDAPTARPPAKPESASANEATPAKAADGRMSRRRDDRRPGADALPQWAEPPATAAAPSILGSLSAITMPAPPPADGSPAVEEQGKQAHAQPTAGATAETSATNASPDTPASSRDAASVIRAVAFVQQLSELLGDARITAVRMTVGSDVRHATDDAGNGSLSTHDQTATALPPAAQSRVPLADGDRVVLPGPTSRQPVLSDVPLGPRDRSPNAQPYSQGLRDSAPVVATDTGAGRAVPVPTETVNVRLAAPLAQRAAPDATTLLESTRGRAAPVPKVPVNRQELPAAPVKEARRDDRPREADRPAASAASDSQGRASVAASGQSDAPSRAEMRSREAPDGEARNLRFGEETPDRPAGLADRITLQVADAEGRQTRIRVQVLGDQVRAVIVPSDQESAGHLERRMDDLQAALIRQGFTDSKVTVQSAGGPAGSTWAAAAGRTATENTPTRSTDQPAGDQRQGSGNREQGRQGDGQRHPHSRPRERDPDDRQNQDA